MAMIGYGAKISSSTSEAGSYTEFPDVSEITMPALEAAYVEVTHLQSPDRWREYVPGLKEPGECSFTQRYSDTALDFALDNKGVLLYWKIEFPDGGIAAFPGALSRSECNLQVDQPVDIRHTLRVLGAVTFTVGA